MYLATSCSSRLARYILSASDTACELRQDASACWFYYYSVRMYGGPTRFGLEGVDEARCDGRPLAARNPGTHLQCVNVHVNVICGGHPAPRAGFESASRVLAQASARATSDAPSSELLSFVPRPQAKMLDLDGGGPSLGTGLAHRIALRVGDRGSGPSRFFFLQAA
jgi:hypothetical protein